MASHDRAPGLVGKGPIRWETGCSTPQTRSSIVEFHPLLKAKNLALAQVVKHNKAQVTLRDPITEHVVVFCSGVVAAVP